MELSSPKLKKTPVFFCFFFRRTLRAFHHCFFRCFHFTTDFYYCFSSVFISPTFFTVTVFFLSGTSFLCYCTASATDLREHFFTLRHFFPQTHSPHLPQYRECYVFQRPLFTVRCFLPYTPSPHLPQYRECFGYERAFFILRGFYLTLLPNKTPLRADNSPLKVAEPLTEVQNTDPAHVFV